MTDYYTTQEVADRLGVSVFTIRRYVRAGKMRGVRLEGAYRISREDLRSFLRAREIGPGAEEGPSNPSAPPGTTNR